MRQFKKIKIGSKKYSAVKNQNVKIWNSQSFMIKNADFTFDAILALTS